MGPLLTNRGLPLDVAAIGAVIMAHEQAHLGRQRQHALDRVVEHARIPTREISTRRAAIRHEQSISHKGGIANHMGHAGRRMAGCIKDKSLHPADAVAVTILEQGVELAAIALEFGAFIEDLAEGVLHHGDLVTDADFSAQFLLNIGGRRKVIGMDMGLDQPFKCQAVFLDMGDDLIGIIIGDPTRCIIDIHDAIDHGAGGRIGVFHDI